MCLATNIVRRKDGRYYVRMRMLSPGGRPRLGPRSIRKGSKDSHSSSDIKPRIKAALLQREALNHFAAESGIHFVNRT
jgi:hypothetical protein